MQADKKTLNQRDFKEKTVKIRFSEGEFVVGRVGFEHRTKPD